MYILLYYKQCWINSYFKWKSWVLNVFLGNGQSKVWACFYVDLACFLGCRQKAADEFNPLYILLLVVHNHSCMLLLLLVAPPFVQVATVAAMRRAPAFFRNQFLFYSIALVTIDNSHMIKLYAWNKVRKISSSYLIPRFK